MNEHNVSFIFFNLDESSNIRNELQQVYTQQEIANFQYLDDSAKALDSIKVSGCGVFVFQFETRNDFIKAMTVLKACQKLSSKGVFRALCITDVDNEKVLNLLHKYNCTDVVPQNTKIKTLKLKLNLWERSIINSLNENNQSDLVLTQREADYQAGDLNAKKSDSSSEDVTSVLVSEIDSEVSLSSEELEELDDLEENFAENFEESELFDQSDEELLDDLDDVFDESAQDLAFGADENYESDVTEVEDVNTEISDSNVIDFKRNDSNNVDVNLESGDLFVDLVGRDSEDKVSLDLKCRFESFFEDEVVVEVPKDNMISESTVVEVCIKFVYNKCRVELILDGHVIECEETDDAGNIVTIKLNRKENDKLDHFMLLFQERQESVTTFLALAKGH